MKPKLSVIIIAKNEQARLAKCLANVAFATERIVVDNGSTDKTVEIAKAKGAIVYEAGVRDFSGIRELGMRQATGTWIFYLDADEEVGPHLKSEIQRIIRLPKDSVKPVYYVKRDTYYLGFHWPYKDMVERLFLKSALKGWHGKLHETPVFVGDTGVLPYPLIHRTHRTIEEMVDKTNDWSDIEALLRFNAHHPPVVWWRFLRVMLTGFIRSYIELRGWRAGTLGFIESMYQAFSMFITYAKLWELQQKKSGH